MLSPSLVSMLLHSMWVDLAPQPGYTPLLSPNNVDDDLARLLLRFCDSPRPMPSVPIVGYSDSVVALGSYARELQEATQGPGPRHVFGRVPIDLIISQFHATWNVPGEFDYIDLGTSLREAQQFNITGHQKCLTWLSNHPQDPINPSRITVAIIDRGIDLAANQQQETLGKRLVHVMNDVDFSPHASLVLTEIIARLASNGLLSSCDLVCALVKPPIKPIGRTCFEHANIVELEQAIVSLNGYVTDASRRSSSLSQSSHTVSTAP